MRGESPELPASAAASWQAPSEAAPCRACSEPLAALESADLMDHNQLSDSCPSREESDAEDQAMRK